VVITRRETYEKSGRIVSDETREFPLLDVVAALWIEEANDGD
jgi:hypothetical protein